MKLVKRITTFILAPLLAGNGFSLWWAIVGKLMSSSMLAIRAAAGPDFSGVLPICPAASRKVDTD